VADVVQHHLLHVGAVARLHAAQLHVRHVLLPEARPQPAGGLARVTCQRHFRRLLAEFTREENLLTRTKSKNGTHFLKLCWVVRKFTRAALVAVWWCKGMIPLKFKNVKSLFL
jgi:hypothetical protein